MASATEQRFLQIDLAGQGAALRQPVATSWAVEPLQTKAFALAFGVGPDVVAVAPNLIGFPAA
jgi:hypothetical protein